MSHKVLSTLACAIVATGVASAQGSSIYIDIDDTASGAITPSNTFAAAAPSGGTWNPIDMSASAGGTLVVSGLLNAGGAPSGVTLTADGATFDPLTFLFDEPNTAGDDQALMDDVGYYGGAGTWTFSGLAAGTYDVFTYAMAPDDPTFLTSVDVMGSASGSQDVGGSFAAGYVLGATHAMHTVTIATGGDIVITTDVGATFDSINGIQIVGAGAMTSIGTPYCMAELNSTGSFGTMSALGSTTATANNVTLTAASLPLNQFGIFVVSQVQGFVPLAGGTSNGNICLGGVVGRFQGPGQILSSGAGGEFSLAIDTAAIPEGGGTVAAAAGLSFNFQAWYRDGVGLGSNFTEGLEIVFN